MTDLSKLKALVEREFDTPSSTTAVPESKIAEYEGRLPAAWLELWREYGLAGFNNDRIRFTDPTEWQPAVDAWRATMKSRKLKEQQLCVVRSSYGMMLCFSPSNGFALTIVPLRWRYSVNPWPKKRIPALPAEPAWDDTVLEVFDTVLNSLWGDMPNGGRASGIMTELFEENLGKLSSDEMWSFNPSMREGGLNLTKQVTKVKAIPELIRLAALGPAIQVDWGDEYKRTENADGYDAIPEGK